jgi:hypothetical protein
MEARPKLTDEELGKIKEENRRRFCGRIGELASPARPVEIEAAAVSQQEML